MTTLERQRGRIAARFVLDALYRDAIDRREAELAAIYARGIMTVDEATRREIEEGE